VCWLDPFGSAEGATPASEGCRPGILWQCGKLPKKGFQREGIARDGGSLPPPKRPRGNSLYAVAFLDTRRKLRNDATNAMLRRAMLIRFVHPTGFNFVPGQPISPGHER
jgi:hypothetical protein